MVRKKWFQILYLDRNFKNNFFKEIEMTSQNKQITYSSVSSPSSSKSPNMSTNSPYYNTNNKFSLLF